MIQVRMYFNREFQGIWQLVRIEENRFIWQYIEGSYDNCNLQIPLLRLDLGRNISWNAIQHGFEESDLDNLK